MMSIRKLLQLSNLTKIEAERMGLLNICPECKREILRHNQPDFRTCLMYLAEKNTSRNPVP